MARRRFFVPEIRRGCAELTGSDAEHLVRVLRAEPGQIYELSDNDRLYSAQIETARKSLVVFRVLEELEVPSPQVQITVGAALIKLDRFEWLLEKCTELGVDRIQPIQATRSEHGLAQASARKRERWEKILIEASQQSRRVRLPILETTIAFAKSIQGQADVRLILDETPGAPSLLAQLPGNHSAPTHVFLLIGPEGGWTDEERTGALEAGWLPCNLGPTILRAETAAAAGLAIVRAHWAKPG